MSYILDAIRKSEHERQMREAPTLSALPNVSLPSSKRPVWFWPVIILMSLNLVVLAFWFWYKNNSAPTTVNIDTQTSTIAPIHTTQIAESKQQPIIANKSVSAKATQQSKTPVNQSQSIADMLDKPPSISQQVPAKPRVIPKKTAAAQSKRPKFATTQQPAKIAPSTPPRTPQSAAKKQTNTIPYLHTLSQDFQNRVPPLKMNIHMYSDEAKDSFAIINMTKYRTGEIISEGLKLEKITANGLVLSFDDQTFQLNHP